MINDILLGGIIAIISYLLALKQTKKNTLFKKKFDYFIEISDKLEEETKDYFLIIREIINSKKTSKVKLNEFESKLDFHEKNFGSNKLVLFESKKVHEASLEYFKVIDNLRKYIKKRVINKTELLDIRKDMLSKMHGMLKEIKNEVLK